LTPFLYSVVTENAQQSTFYKDGDKATGYIRQGIKVNSIPVVTMNSL